MKVLLLGASGLSADAGIVICHMCVENILYNCTPHSSWPMSGLLGMGTHVYRLETLL